MSIIYSSNSYRILNSRSSSSSSPTLFVLIFKVLWHNIVHVFSSYYIKLCKKVSCTYYFHCWMERTRWWSKHDQTKQMQINMGGYSSHAMQQKIEGSTDPKYTKKKREKIVHANDDTAEFYLVLICPHYVISNHD